MSGGAESQNSKSNLCSSATWGGRLLAVCILLLTANLGYGTSPKLSKDLQEATAAGQVNVIIQFRQAPTAADHQKVARRGGTLNRELDVVKAGAYTVPARALAKLASDPEVAYIAPDRPLNRTTVDTSQLLDYYPAAVNAPYAWGLGLDGSGIGVAVIGIRDLHDLRGQNSRLVYSQNFVPGLGGGAKDAYGHGTHVAGMIAAIQTAIQFKNTYNIRVINLSLGRAVYESYTLDPLCQAAEQAWRAGIVVVVAAGNDGRNNSVATSGYGTINAPGDDPYVITVGAMNTEGTPNRSDDVIASYSSKGPTLYDHLVKPDLVAPGNRIVSLYTSGLLLNQLYPGNEIPFSLYQTNGHSSPSGSYYRLSGTSMAAPMVSGAVALILQQNPTLTPDQVKARLMTTAYKNLLPYSTAVDPVTNQIYNSQSDIFTVGAGYLDIQAALNNTDLAPVTVGSALSPTAARDSNGNIVLTNNSGTIWGNSNPWSNTVVWGVGVLSGVDLAGQSTLWGSTVCWGTTTMQGFSVVWGQTVVWGVTTPAGEAATLAINGED